MYWSDSWPGDDLIMRADLDGSNPIEIMQNVRVSDLKVDSQTGKIYIVQKVEGRLLRLSLDGPRLETLASGLTEPWHLALSFEAPISITPSSWGKVMSKYRNAGE
jgi:hypothetical protein